MLSQSMSSQLLSILSKDFQCSKQSLEIIDHKMANNVLVVLNSKILNDEDKRQYHDVDKIYMIDFYQLDSDSLSRISHSSIIVAGNKDSISNDTNKTLIGLFDLEKSKEILKNIEFNIIDNDVMVTKF